MSASCTSPLGAICPACSTHICRAWQLQLAANSMLNSGAAGFHCRETMNVEQGAVWLEQMARRRRAVFSSRQAAMESLQKRVPFALLRRDVLQAYVKYGLRDLQGGPDSFDLVLYSAPVSSSRRVLGHFRADGTCTLKCTRDSEARVFKATGLASNVPAVLQSVRTIAVPVTIASGGGAEESKFAYLAREAPVLVRLLQAGRLEVFDSLFHLGPLEDPGMVAKRVMHNFLLAVSDQDAWRALPQTQKWPAARL